MSLNDKHPLANLHRDWPTANGPRPNSNNITDPKMEDVARFDEGDEGNQDLIETF